MGLQIQRDIRKSKRKLSIFLNLPDSSSFSQNPLISTPAEKKKKGSFFSQSQPTQDIQNIPIYSEYIGILDRKSTRLNSSHDQISYAVFCLKKNKMGLLLKYRVNP